MTFADRGPVARRALPYAVSLAALCVAAGCTSGSPAPTASTALPTTTTSSSAATTSATTTATPSPSVDPVVAKIPAAARPETIGGAAAFAKFYFDTLNTAFRERGPRARSMVSASPVVHDCARVP